MKKRITWILALGITLSLCACTKSASDFKRSHTEQAGGSESAMDEKEDNIGTEAGTPAETTGNDALSLLCMLQGTDRAYATDSGCYYIANDGERLADGRYAAHLMYVDAATKQEIYLCNNAACTHNTVDCTSVLLTDDFPLYSTLLFMWNDNLYLLSKEQDDDGSTVMGVFGDDIGTAIESAPTILYRANPDGTERDKVYTFDSTVTVEDFVVGDSGGLYFITKKVTTQQENGNSYQISSERKLVYLDLSAKTEKEICSMDFGGNIVWDVIGVSGRMLILYGIDFGREVSSEEMHSDDIHIYDDSYDVFATLTIDDVSLHEFYRVYAPKSRSYAVGVDKLYFSVDGSGSIVSVDFYTGEETTLCAIAENLIWGMIGDKLYCYDSGDHTFYFVDVNTGEISHSGLVNKTTGWGLRFIAEIGGWVLVNYDSEGSFGSDGSFHSIGEYYGLIEKEDLFAGVDNFIPIGMAGEGIE